MSDTISPLPDPAAEDKTTKPAPEPSSSSQPDPHNLPVPERKLGIALVGLGTYSEEELGPALTETMYCRLAGVVSGSAEKRERWRHEYNLREQNLYSYENFDDIRFNQDIDIVYIVLPNAMHAEYVIRAARARKHVICEKPMATSVEDCRRMIEACRQAGVRLSMGYRLHFDPFNQEMMRLGQSGSFGAVSDVVAKNGMDVGDKHQWRLKQDLAGGGPLMDVGIYAVQGALYTIGELPIAVTAQFHRKTDFEKFAEVEEGMDWEMEFPSGIKASCQTSYSQEYNILRAQAEKGWFELQPAYAYNGLKGKTSDGPMILTSLNQQAAQMDDFALCVQNNTPTRVPGEMGLRDLEILMAIYKAAQTGKRVELRLEEFQKLIEI
jgi:predicted dehydrogenase